MREGEASGTALIIGLSLLYLGRTRPRSLVSDEEIRLLNAGLPRLGNRARALSAAVRSPFGRLLVAGLEACIVPGIVLHYALRKRAIERLVRDSLKDGYRRVVVVAAGLDLLAHRLMEEDPRLDCIEIDHPATQRAKKLLLDGRSRVRFIPADLSRTRLPEALAPFLGPELSDTLVVIEGLTMYLSPRRVSDLWQDVAAIRSGRSRMVCTFMEPGADGKATFLSQTGLLDRLLSLTNERFDQGIRLERIGRMLSDCGWRMSALLGRAEFQALGSAAAPKGEKHQPVGEWVVVADRETDPVSPVRFDPATAFYPQSTEP